MSRTFSISVDLGGLDAAVEGIANDAEAAARPAAQAMAQVLYDEVQRNVSRIKKKTGNLARSIYQAYSDRSTPMVPVYHISWNSKKAPHGHLVEFGHLQRYEISFDPVSKRFTTHKDKPLAAPRQVGAKPFLRPALGKLEQARDAGRAEFFRRMGAKP